MKEQFVPYEIALKLKEKGFDEFCISKYEENYLCQDEGFDVCLDDTWLTNTKFNRSNPKYCTAPLWQQVIDWLESKHGVVINVTTFIRREDGKPHIKMFYVHKHPLVPKTFECGVSDTLKTKCDVIEYALTLI